MTNTRSFTLAEALVIVAVVLLLIFVALMVLPGLRRGHHHPRWMQSNTNMRGIHQSLVVQAQYNGGYFVGLDSEGEPDQLDVEQRFQLLVDQNAISPEMLINPAERGRQEWESGPFTSDHYSYAMLQVPESGGRYEEWSETINSNAIVLSERNTGTDVNPASVFSDAEHPGWQGGVAWNDNRVEYVRTPIHDTIYDDIANKDDHIFRANGDDDAYLIHSGN